MRIFVAGVDADWRQQVVQILEAAGFAADEVGSLEVRGEAAGRWHAGILLVEAAGGADVRVCQSVRTACPLLSLLAITPTDAVEQRVKLLDAGADDVISWPLQRGELLARLRAVLRRSCENRASVLRVGNVVMDTNRRQASCNEVPLALTRREYALLETLMRHSGIPVTRRYIQEAVWHDSSSVSNNVDACVYQLRRKLATAGERRFIRAVYGVGYMVGNTEQG